MHTKKNYINSFTLFLTVLVIFIPLAQVTGPFLTDFLISLSALSYILIILLLNNQLHKDNRYLNILLLFWIFILFTALMSDYKYLSIKPSLTFFRFIVFCFVVIFIINNNKKFFLNFNISIIVVLSVLIFDGYFQFIFGKNIIGLKQLRPDRLSSFFYDELILGSYLLKFLPIMLFLYYQNLKNEKVKLLNSIIIISIIPLIFLTGERAAFFLSILFCFLVMPFIFSIKKFLSILASFLILAIVIISSSGVVYDRYINQLKDHVILKKENETIFFPEHIGLFNSAYNNFLKNKLIGSGVKSFRETCKDNNSNYKKKIEKIKNNIDFCSTHPHNYYLQFLTELGLIGFLFLSFIFGFCVIKYFKSLAVLYLNKSKDLLLFKKYIILLSGLIMFLWPITTAGNFFNNYNSSFIFLNLSFFLYINNEYNSKIKR